MTAILLSLGSAATFGAADFLGGLATRRSSTLPITVISQAVGLAVLALGVLVLPGEASPAAFGWGMLAGLCGAGGEEAGECARYDCQRNDSSHHGSFLML